jgi:hypothetical protein
LLLLIGSILCLGTAVALLRVAYASGYREGVRDGYGAPWLPRVAEQIEREDLRRAWE